MIIKFKIISIFFFDYSDNKNIFAEHQRCEAKMQGVWGDDLHIFEDCKAVPHTALRRRVVIVIFGNYFPE